MSDCPQERLQALRWGFRETLLHASRLPTYSEFESHFTGDDVPETFREALYQLYAQFLKSFQNICTEEFELLLREHDVPQAVQKLDDADRSRDEMAQQLSVEICQAEQAQCDMLQRQIQLLKEAVATKAARISNLKAAKEKHDQQKSVDRETAQVLREWNSRTNPAAVTQWELSRPSGKDE